MDENEHDRRVKAVARALRSELVLNGNITVNVTNDELRRIARVLAEAEDSPDA